MLNYGNWKIALGLFILCGSLSLVGEAVPSNNPATKNRINLIDLREYAAICSTLMPSFAFPTEPDKVIKARARCIANLDLCKADPECLGAYLEKLLK